MYSRMKFDPEKAVEVILYISSKLQDPTFHKISKILYFADLEHLGSYGCSITGDNYIAMRNGPVPSGSYDIMKSTRNAAIFSGFMHHARDAFDVREDGYTLVPLRNPDTDLISKSDLACLDHSIQKYGCMSFGQLTELSHDRAWNSASDNDVIPLEEMIAMLPNSEDIFEYINDPTP